MVVGRMTVSSGVCFGVIAHTEGAAGLTTTSRTDARTSEASSETS